MANVNNKNNFATENEVNLFSLGLICIQFCGRQRSVQVCGGQEKIRHTLSLNISFSKLSYLIIPCCFQ